MGIYDTLHGKCAHCGEYCEKQQKPGTFIFFDLERATGAELARFCGKNELLCGMCSGVTVVTIEVEKVSVSISKKEKEIAKEIARGQS